MAQIERPALGLDGQISEPPVQKFSLRISLASVLELPLARMSDSKEPETPYRFEEGPLSKPDSGRSALPSTPPGLDLARELASDMGIPIRNRDQGTERLRR